MYSKKKFFFLDTYKKKLLTELMRGISWSIAGFNSESFPKLHQRIVQPSNQLSVQVTEPAHKVTAKHGFKLMEP